MKEKSKANIGLLISIALLLIALPLLGACTKEVVKEVPVEKIVEKEVVKEVPVEKVVVKEVIKEVPVEKVVIKEVPAAEVKKYLIRLQCHAPLDNFAFVRTQRWAHMVEERSNGQIEFKFYPLSQLAPPGEALNALAAGALEMLMTGAMFFGGTNNIGGWMMMPYAFPSPNALAEAWWEKGLGKIMDEAYQKRSNVKLLYYQMIPGQSLFSTKPVYKLEDWKPLTVAALGGEISRTVKALGAAAATGIAPPGAYVAIQRGTVDGIFGNIVMIRAYKLDEAGVKYIILPHIIPVNALPVYMNLDTWNSLPDNLQKLMLDTAKEATYDDIKHFEGGEQVEVEFAKGKGVEFITISPEEQKRWKNAVIAAGLRDWYVELCEKQGLGDEAKKIVGIMETFE